MDPVTVAAVVGYLAKTIKENKAFKEFTADLTEASVNWIRPIFLKEDSTPKEVLKELQEKPDSASRRKAAEAAIMTRIEDYPEEGHYLKEIFESINKKNTTSQNTVTNSKNVNTGNISAGGNVSIGDKH
ncbi:hypothetical protein CLV58_1537 [Spirosoma oryzae]|uniref:Uncharacterized protein n=1 Tax=Spirosoma oryzae TaxID=1469603 RepID=A0A2T0RJ17_9BACT|nr:hypothetical protein [Spirosoma oryzae]PRY21117.1 hypothetical protein CLV58_1537 [Spirosoma oryzae]